MTEQIPVIINSSRSLTPLPGGTLISALIASAGEQASWRYVDFLPAHIRNPDLPLIIKQNRLKGGFIHQLATKGRTTTTGKTENARLGVLPNPKSGYFFIKRSRLAALRNASF